VQTVAKFLNPGWRGVREWGSGGKININLLITHSPFPCYYQLRIT
jgi:hypothetical protein